MAKVTLAEEPLQIAVGGGANHWAAEGGFLVSVATRVGAMALGAMILKEEAAGCCCLGLAGKGVLAGVVTRRNGGEVRDRGGKGRAGGDSEEQNRGNEAFAIHRAAPVRLRNQPPIGGNSYAIPTRYMRLRLLPVRPNAGEKLRRTPRGRSHPASGAR